MDLELGYGFQLKCVYLLMTLLEAWHCTNSAYQFLSRIAEHLELLVLNSGQYLIYSKNIAVYIRLNFKVTLSLDWIIRMETANWNKSK
jgi:hypothetical protein